MDAVGTWLSLVEHSVRDAGVAGSNPVVPTRGTSHWFSLDQAEPFFVAFYITAILNSPERLALQAL